MELEDQILARIVTRPIRQASAIGIACSGEVDPIALRHARDGPIFVRCRRRWRSKTADAQRAEYESNFATVRCPGSKHLPHSCLHIGEPIEINGRTVFRER